MKRVNYQYQDVAAEKVLENALDSRYIASVLAACPSSGKTTISHKILNKYFTKFPHARALVLTEGQNTLKNQYLSELTCPNVSIRFTFGPLGSNSQVQVGIPQNIKDLVGTIDLLIVDEAHNYFLAPMVQEIVEHIKPKHIILMTGSPTKYNLHNQQSKFKYGMHYIAAEDLNNNNVFSAANMDVAVVSNAEDAAATIKTAMAHAIKNGDNLSKIMVACPAIAYANKVAAYLGSIGRSVSLSTSKNDIDDVEISNFKQGLTDTLIVVGRGILGFNDANMTALFDLRSSGNVDASYQLFARILRVHPQNAVKTYIRVAEKNKYNAEVMMLHKMHALMDREVFMGFTGDNLTVSASLY